MKDADVNVFERLSRVRHLFFCRRVIDDHILFLSLIFNSEFKQIFLYLIMLINIYLLNLFN